MESKPQRTYVASLDQGTSSTRFMVFDEEGNVIANYQEENTQMFPKPGHVEHDPIEMWQRSQNCIAGALRVAKVEASQIAALGITNQRETTIVWNKVTGVPYHNAIVWNDDRTSSICEMLSQRGGKDRLRSKTGLPIAPYFSASKLMWLLDVVPGLRADAEAGIALFGTVDTWLIWNLTAGAVYVTDVTNASRTMMMNIRTLDWDDDILNEFNIPRIMLPTIRSSSMHFGKVAASTFRSKLVPLAGLDDLAGVEIAGILGDQQAALFGQTCFAVGEAQCTYGTGAFLLMGTGNTCVISTSGLLTTVAYQLEGSDVCYALEGSVSYAGLLIQWLRDNLQIIDSLADSENVASQVRGSHSYYLIYVMHTL
jgi:glycerol kinase